MAALLGITLPELLGTPPGVLNILPASALRFIRQLSLVPTAAGVADGAVLDQLVAERPTAPRFLRVTMARADRQRPARPVLLHRRGDQLHRARLTLAEPLCGELRRPPAR